MSSMKRHTYTYRELESLDEDQWNDFVGITDDQATQSDIGGDSDADDCFDESFSTSTLSTRSRHQGSCSGTSSSSQPPQEFLFVPSPPIPPSPPLQLPPSSPPQSLSINPTTYQEIISPEDAAPRENIIHEDLTKCSSIRFREPPVYKNSTFNNYVGIKTEVDLNSPLKILTLFLTPFFSIS